MHLSLLCPTYPKSGNRAEGFAPQCFTVSYKNRASQAKYLGNFVCSLTDIRIQPGQEGYDIDRYINRLVTKLFSQLGGNTPLHRAVEGGHSEVVKQLLLSQTNLNIENDVSSAISCASTITLYFINRVELDGSLDRTVGQWVGGYDQQLLYGKHIPFVKLMLGLMENNM